MGWEWEKGMETGIMAKLEGAGRDYYEQKSILLVYNLEGSFGMGYIGEKTSGLNSV